MAEYINLTTMRYPMSERDIREEMPNTSFPLPFPCPDGYAVVFPSPIPAYDTVVQMPRVVAPQEIDGQWYQQWEVVPRFVEYTDADGVTRTVAEQEAAAIAEAAAEQEKALIASYDAALGRLFDAKASERTYRDRYTCAIRAGYPGPFQAEGIAFATWMDTCNALGYQIMADVRSGLRPLPTLEEFLAEMPQLAWPA